MIFYAVRFSNYFPEEIEGVYATKEEAENVAEKLNEEGATAMWEVVEYPVCNCNATTHSKEGR